MIFQNPWALLSVPIAVATAVMVLLRSRRRVVAVSSLRLWREVIREAEPPGRRRRSVSPAWLLLTAGAMAAAMTLGSPVWPSRRILPIASGQDDQEHAKIILDAVAAEPLPDGSSELFVAVRNRSSIGRQATLTVSFDTGAPDISHVTDLQGGQRIERVIPIPGEVGNLTISVGGRAGQHVELAAISRPRRKVAVIGADNLFIRKFLTAAEGVEQVGDAEDADAVIAVGVDPPTDRAGIFFDAPTPPSGWRYADSPAGPVEAGRSDVLADSPLMRHVNFAGVTIRQVRPLAATAGAAGEPLVTIPAGVLMLTTDRPRRLHVAFDPAGPNTGWGLDESFPILMDAALAWVAPGEAEVAWEPTAGAVPQEPPLDDGSVDTGSTPEAAGVRLWSPAAATAGVLWLFGWWRQAAEDGPVTRD